MSVNLMKALSKAHHANPTGLIIPKGTKGARALYTNLPDVLRYIDSMCEPHGLILYQASCVVDGKPGLYSKLTHTPSGEFIDSTSLLTMAPNPQNPDQLWGGSTTYHRRYDAMMLCGLFCEDDPEDDDGYKNSRKADDLKPTSPATEEKKPLTEIQLKALVAKINGNTELEQIILKIYDISKLGDLPQFRYDGLCKWIDRKNSAVGK